MIDSGAVHLLARHLQLLTVAFLILAAEIQSTVKAQAQIMPDKTLGTENSTFNIVGNQTNINGGALRGANLFHSFQEFNVSEGKSAFFGNPNGVSTIFSRVTGSNASDIFGTLGVSGDANLFFMNPNGIIFGPNSRLDIDGSFVGTTATSLDLGGGLIFSAITPDAVPLLDIQVEAPIGLRFEGSEVGPILSNTRLTVPSGNQLILAAGTIASLSPLSAPGGEVSLITVDPANLDTFNRVQVGKDGRLIELAQENFEQVSSNIITNPISLTEATKRVMAEPQSLEGLELGDIVVDNISTQAKSINAGPVNIFASRNLTVKQVSASSVIDVEMNAVGNGGEINLHSRGDIVVTESLFTNSQINVPKHSVDKFGGVPGESARISVISQDGGITVRKTLFSLNNTGGNGGDISLHANKNISIEEGIVSTSECGGQACTTGKSGNAGDVSIISTNGLIHFPQVGQDGEGNPKIGDSIKANSIVNGIGQSGDGGTISLRSRDGLTVGAIDSSSRVTAAGQAGSGGGVMTISHSGDVNIGNIFTRSLVSNEGTSGNAGNVSIESGKNVLINLPFQDAGINATSVVEGNDLLNQNIANRGGNVDIQAEEQISIERIETISNVFGAGMSDNAGSISVTSSNGGIEVNSLVAYSEVANDGQAGDGGKIFIDSGGDLAASTVWAFSQAGNGGRDNQTGVAGDITLKSGGKITVSNSNSFGVILAVSQIDGDGISLGAGNVYLQSRDDLIVNSLVDPSDPTRQTNSIATSSQVLGDGQVGATGDITITSLEGNILVDNIATNTRVTGSGSLGAVGNIRIEAPQGSIRTGNIFSRVDVLGFGTAPDGGDISLSSQRDITIPTLFSNSLSGGCATDGCNDLVAGQGGNIEISSAEGKLDFIRLTNNQGVPLNNPGIQSFSQVQSRGRANGSGNIRIWTPNQALSLNDIEVSSNAFSGGSAGNIDVQAKSLTLLGSELTANSSGDGPGGQVSVNVDDDVLLDRSRLFTSLELGAQGRGGDLSVTGDSITLNNFSLIDTATFGAGDAGRVTLTARDAVVLAGGSQIFSITSGAGNGGNVNVQANDSVNILGPSSISTIVNSDAQGRGGDVRVSATNLSLVDGGQILSSNFSDGVAGDIHVDIAERIAIVGSATDFTSRTFPDRGAVDNPVVMESALGNNNSPETAPALDSLFAKATTSQSDVEFSTQIPFTTVQGTIDANNSATDFYSFEVTAGTRAVFDVDTSSQTNAGETDLSIALFDTAGNQLDRIGAFNTFNNDAAFSLGGGGSQPRADDGRVGTGSNRSNSSPVISADPYLRFIFTEPGRFVIGVTRSFSATDSSTDINYNLNISLDTPPAGSLTEDTLTSGLFARNDSLLDAGVAGTINASANILDLNNLGRIDTITLSGDGGNINLDLNDFLFLNNGSAISTTAGTALTGGDGGLVAIDIPNGFIVSPTFGNSDITANAFTGSGGQVNITTAGIFGIEFRNAPTTLSDITASSVLGPQGIVTIDLTEPDAQRGLNQLVEEPRNPTIVNSCQNVGGRDAVEVLRVGRGGLPPNPNEPLGADDSDFIPLIKNDPSSIDKDLVQDKTVRQNNQRELSVSASGLDFAPCQ